MRNSTLDQTTRFSIQYNDSINSSFTSTCIPLFKNFSITHFFYIRIFRNLSFLYLCNDTKWVENYFENNFQDDPFHMQVYKTTDMSYSLWSSFKRDKVYSALYDFNIWNGLNIYEKQDDDSMVVYAFGTTLSNEEIANFYINNLDVFKSFILYFKNKSSDIINLFDASKLIVSKAALYSQPSPKNNVEQFYQQINAQPIFFMGNRIGSCLTKSEVNCLYQLINGKTAKEIGKSLGLSPRTIEFYLSNIKRKTGLRTKAELIRGTLDGIRLGKI